MHICWLRNGNSPILFTFFVRHVIRSSFCSLFISIRVARIFLVLFPFVHHSFLLLFCCRVILPKGVSRQLNTKWNSVIIPLLLCHIAFFLCRCTYIFTNPNNQMMCSAFWIWNVEHAAWDEIFFVIFLYSVFILISFSSFACLFMWEIGIDAYSCRHSSSQCHKDTANMTKSTFYSCCFPFAQFRISLLSLDFSLSLFSWHFLPFCRRPIYKIKTHVYCGSEFPTVMYAK